MLGCYQYMHSLFSQLQHCPMLKVEATRLVLALHKPPMLPPPAEKEEDGATQTNLLQLSRKQPLRTPLSLQVHADLMIDLSFSSS